jgi:hypothetical protein
MTTLTFARINGTGTIAKGSAPISLSGTSDDIGATVTVTLSPVNDPGVTTPQSLLATVQANGTWSVPFDPSTVPQAQYAFDARIGTVLAVQGAYIGSPVAQFVDDNGGELQNKLAAGGRYLVEVSGGQAYRLDLQTGQRVLASADANGNAADAAVSDVAISGDGRYVAFDTTATNLGAGLDGEQEVWRKDMLTGQLTLVSVDANGTPGNNIPAETAGLYLASQSYSALAGMTPDGTQVFYTTNQANLTGVTPNDGTAITPPEVVTGVMRATLGGDQIVDGLPTAATVSTNEVFVQSYTLSNLPPGGVAAVAIYNGPGIGGITFDIADPRGYAIVGGFSDDGTKVAINYDAERAYGSTSVGQEYVSTYYDISSIVAGDGSSIVNAGPNDPGAVAEVASTDSNFYSLGDPYSSVLSGDGSAILAYRDTGTGFAVTAGPNVELGDGQAVYSDNGKTLYYATPSTPGQFFSAPLAVAYNTVTGQLVLSAINANGSVFNGSPVGVSTNQNATLLYSFGATFTNQGASPWNDGQGFYITYNSPAPALHPRMASGNLAFVYQGSGPATLSGTSDAIGQQVEIDLGSAGVGSAFATVAADGTWSASVAQSLITPGITAYVSVTSAAGTPTLVTDTAQLIAAPSTPVVTPFTGPLDYAQPYISGTADAGDTVTVYDGTTVLGTTVAQSSGAFYFQPTTALTEGTHPITATASDSSGDVSAASGEQDLVIDLTPPAETVSTLMVAGDDTVSVAEQATGLMTVTGTLSAPLAAGDTVEVQVAGSYTIVAATATVGSTSFTASIPIPAISGQVSAYVQDTAGNQTMATTQAFTVTPVNTVKQITPLAGDTSDSVPSLSANGAFLAFQGTSQFSVSGLIELANLSTGAVVDASGGLPSVSAPSLSGDGGEVAVLSADPATFAKQVYVVNVATGAAALVSHAAGVDTAGDAASFAPQLSEDGQHVVFESAANNLTSDHVSALQVYEGTLTNGAWTIRLVSTGPSGAASSEASSPSVSADGRVVVFTSNAGNLVDEGRYTGSQQVFATVFDAQGNGTVEVVSSNAQGVLGLDGTSTGGVVSGNGRYVVFQSTDDNLVPGVSSNEQVFRKDLVTGAVVLVSSDAQGNAGTDSSFGASVSDDGNLVAFETYAPNLTNAPQTDEDEPLQVVVKNLTTGAVWLASSGSTVGSDGSVSGSIALSGDGSIVAFASRAQDLVAGATGDNQLIYTSTDTVACYLHGTLIATPTGERPIETLAIGDLVSTFDGPGRPIRWIGRRSYDRRFVAANPDVIPIRIARGAIAQGVPHTDLLVSPQHAMFIGGVLVPANLLVNGETITEADDIGVIRYIHLELASHDILLANGAPSESFVNCDNRGLFHNEADYKALYPNDVGPRWAFCASRIEDGHRLEDIRAELALQAGLDDAGAVQTGAVEGYIDLANHEMVSGWAWQPQHPNGPVRLEILVDGGVVAEIVANRARGDVRQAGYGTGRYGFQFTFPKPLSPFGGHVIEVRRHSDKHALSHSPRVLEALPVLDSEGGSALADAIRGHAAGASMEEVEDLLGVLLAGTDRLLDARVRRRARAASGTQVGGGKRRRQSRRAVAEPGGPLALVVDDRMPALGDDAGSVAVLEHMHSLIRLGYRVAFVPRDMTVTGKLARKMEKVGILRLGAPYYVCVEDVLRRHGGDAALIYVRRATNMTLYGELVRDLCPKARLIYSVAELNFLRQAREEAIWNQPDAGSRRLREKEMTAARMADVVITNSKHDTTILGHLLPGLNVHDVPWSCTMAGSEHEFQLDAIDEVMKMTVTLQRPSMGERGAEARVA